MPIFARIAQEPVQQRLVTRLGLFGKKKLFGRLMHRNGPNVVFLWTDGRVGRKDLVGQS